MMNLTLNFNAAMQSLESAKTGEELLNQLDFVVSKLSEEADQGTVPQLSI